MAKKKFPDLSGDGKITMKDILIGRGVIKKKSGGLIEATNKLKAQGLNMGGNPNAKLNKENKKRSLEYKKRLQNKRIAKQKGAFIAPGEGDQILPATDRQKMILKERLKKSNRFADGGPVRGKARGMGAAIKGGGYNV